ncbi:hypothetical protein L3Q82_007906 [Scortum barcoo]|uniref:Uncharacterized protein n=1 Tax=Scortum barcoo TaxID=214431 RepID=A0ACB8WJE2_9TELE|nr:hypothetical protein L3Q82_007906 [Scortum barcoo]
MSRSIHQRHVAPQTVQELADALVQVWEEIPQETIRHLIRSMPSAILPADFTREARAHSSHMALISHVSPPRVHYRNCIACGIHRPLDT